MYCATLILVATLAAAPDTSVDRLFGAPARPENTPKAGEASLPSAPPSLAPVFIVVAVLGAVGIAVPLWRRRRSVLPHPLIRRLAHIPIAPGQGVAVVEIDDRLLVLSTGQGGVHLLHTVNAVSSDMPAAHLPAQDDASEEARALRMHLAAMRDDNLR